MALTFGDGPLASHPRDTVNYRIDGPAHRLLFDPFPRRVRAVFGGAAVLDTTPSGIITDAAWCYPEPLDGVRAIRGYLCFAAEGVQTWVDGVLR